MATDYYAVFGVAPDADIEVIKQRYRVLVRENHPDVSTSEDAHARMQLILEAWSVLSQPDARKRYDLSRRDAAQPTNGTTSTASHQKHRRPGSTQKPRSSSPRPRVDVNPRSSNPRTRLLIMVNEAAQLYQREGNSEAAISLCNRVLKSDPKNSEAAGLLGDIYAAQGRNDIALLMYKRAMQNQPNMLLYRQKWESLQQKVAPGTTDGVTASTASGNGTATPPSKPTPPPASAPPVTPTPRVASSPQAAGCGASIILALGILMIGVTWLLTAL
jgi:curved DNA-binding protein CbpA